MAGRKAAASARTTHGHPLALASAAWFGELLARALQGESKHALLSPWWEGSAASDPDGEVLSIAHAGLEGIPEALISGLQQAERWMEMPDRLATHDHQDQTQLQHPTQSQQPATEKRSVFFVHEGHR